MILLNNFMGTGLETGEIIGIGSVVIAFLGTFWKMWNDHSKLVRWVSDVVKENTKAHEKLSGTLNHLDEAVKINTDVTRTSAESVKKTNDLFTSTLVSAFAVKNNKIRKSRRK